MEKLGYEIVTAEKVPPTRSWSNGFAWKDCTGQTESAALTAGNFTM